MRQKEKERFKMSERLDFEDGERGPSARIVGGL